MANLLAPVPKAKFFDNNGRPAAGYKIFSYEAGTSTKLDTYPDENTGSPNSNPIVLDYRGEANIWMPPNVAYKLVFARPDDTDPPGAPIWTVDDIVNSELVTLWGGVDTGIANAYVLDFVANFSAYEDGIAIFWIPSNTNTGPSTININGLGPVPITNQDGTPLYLGQIKSNEVVLIVYRSTGFTLIAFGLNPTINVQNGDYTFAIGDSNNIVLANAVGTSNWTLPNEATVPFPIGTSIDLITVSPSLKQLLLGAGVTMRYFSRTPQPIVISESATRIVKIGSDEWQQVTPSQFGFSSVGFVADVTGISGATTIALSGGLLDGLVKIVATTSRVNTSTSTSLSITGLPSSLTPSATVYAMCYGVQDNGVNQPAIATITSAGEITFQLATVPPSGFTGSGDKGVIAGFSLVYPLR